VVVADSAVRRELATSAYNDRRADCEQAVRILQEDDPEVQSLRDVTSPTLAASQSRIPAVVYQRARHVVEEIERVDQARLLLEKGDAHGFGQLMLHGHTSLRDLYEVSCPELDALVNIASQLPGCLGARLTGAGFGGCTVNLVQTHLAIPFMKKLMSAYKNETGRTGQAFLCHASCGAHAEMISGL
jgi:galactokinase